MMLLFDASNRVFVAMIGVVAAYAGFVIGVGILGVVLSRGMLGEPPRWARAVRLHGRRWEIVKGWLGRVRTTVDAFKEMHFGWAAAALLISVFHVAVRFTILPAIVYSATPQDIALAPLVIWPLGFIYGVGILPAPGGGGAVELAFRAALTKVIPAAIFAPALVWWRFYTFYIYIVVGALVAGNTALRAVREVEEAEEELERAE
jgi:glycosyltransferase 2 family protein